jgi:hypothetical protein
MEREETMYTSKLLIPATVLMFAYPCNGTINMASLANRKQSDHNDQATPITVHAEQRG